MVDNEMPQGLWQRLRNRLYDTFDLERDKANEHFTIEALKDDVDFRGAKVWVLIFAIMIASLGLNVNSTAVIIGAMLISPLMGPIIGLGLGLGIMDLDLVKRSFRNLAVMTLISITTATLYFWLSPLSQAQSELLARTQPTIYDVFIALVGGAAGILASSTRNKGNVVTGVAIATALMPPLCTAGYGLSQGNLSYFFGASYLYLINTVFIGLSTLVMVRVLGFPQRQFIDKAREAKFRRWIVVIAVGMALPSIYFGVRLVGKSIVEEGAHRFVRDQLDTSSNQVVRETLDTESRTLEVVLLGQALSEQYIDSIRHLMPAYGLGDVELVVRQGFGQQEEVDIDVLRSVVLKDLYSRSDEMIRRQAEEIDSLRHLLEGYQLHSTLQATLTDEAKSLFPQVTHIMIATAERDGKAVYVGLYESDGRLSDAEEERLRSWLRVRLKAPNLKIVRG